MQQRVLLLDDHPAFRDSVVELSERCIVFTGSQQEDGVHKCVPIEDLLWHVQQVLTS